MSSRHVVSQGECLSSIATKYQFNDWHLVYDDPANADFRKKTAQSQRDFSGVIRSSYRIKKRKGNRALPANCISLSFWGRKPSSASC